MNRIGSSFVVGLCVVCLSARAMENDVIEEVKEVIAAATAEVKNEATVSVNQAVCLSCPVKNACKKSLAFCKKYQVCLAIGAAIAAAVIIYKTIPAVKEQVDALFGVDSTDQTESFDADEHSLPQEQIEIVEVPDTI